MPQLEIKKLLLHNNKTQSKQNAKALLSQLKLPLLNTLVCHWKLYTKEMPFTDLK